MKNLDVVPREFLVTPAAHRLMLRLRGRFSDLSRKRMVNREGHCPTRLALIAQYTPPPPPTTAST